MIMKKKKVDRKVKRYLLGIKYGQKYIDIENFDAKKYLHDVVKLQYLRILDKDDVDDVNENDFWLSYFNRKDMAEFLKEYLNDVLYIAGLYATDIKQVEMEKGLSEDQYRGNKKKSLSIDELRIERNQKRAEEYNRDHRPMFSFRWF